MTIRLALAGPAGAESPNWLSSSPPPPARPQSSHDGPSSSTHPQTRRAPSSAHRSPAQASFPHGLLEGWRELGRKRRDPAARGPRQLHGTPPSCSVSRACETGTEENSGVPHATPAGLVLTGPHPQLLVRETGLRSPGTCTTSRTITEGSLSQPASSLSTTAPAPAPIISHHRGQPRPRRRAQHSLSLFRPGSDASLLPKISQQQRPSIPELPARPPTQLPAPQHDQGLRDPC